MVRPRYGNKSKKKRPGNGVQPPDRGHGLQERESSVESAGANGHSPASRKLRRPRSSPLAEALRGPKMDRGSLLSQSDRRLIRELTEALRECSALLADDAEPGPAPEEKPQEMKQPENAPPEDYEPPEDDVRTQSEETASQLV